METKPTKAKPLTRTTTAEVARTPDGHLFVDVKRPDYSTYRVASSAGLTRLLKSIQPDRNLLLMTAFRGSRSKTQNERMFEQIPGELRSMLGTKRIGAY